MTALKSLPKILNPQDPVFNLSFPDYSGGVPMILLYPVDLNSLSQVIFIFDHMKQIILLKINLGYFL